MEWKDRAQLILEKIRRYRNDEDGWKISKKSVGLNRFLTPLNNNSNNSSRKVIVVVVVVI